VVSEGVRIVLNRAAEHGVLSEGQIEKVLGRTIDFAVTNDYHTVATAVNTGVPSRGCAHRSSKRSPPRSPARSLARS
jgi:hypothetical protein